MAFGTTYKSIRVQKTRDQWLAPDNAQYREGFIAAAKAACSEHSDTIRIQDWRGDTIEEFPR